MNGKTKTSLSPMRSASSGGYPRGDEAEAESIARFEEVTFAFEQSAGFLKSSCLAKSLARRNASAGQRVQVCSSGIECHHLRKKMKFSTDLLPGNWSYA